MVSDTIVAPASPLMPSPIHIIRLSGSKVLEILSKLTRKDFSSKEPRKFYLARIYGENGEELDEGLVVFFKAPHSYTGEDMAEIFIHGNPILTDYIVKLCISYGARYAREGEFTKRAFLNGKVTLEKSEAINSLIRASTLEGVKRSFSVLKGEFEKLMNTLREEILDVVSQVEASIDFPEDVDYELTYEEIMRKVSELYQKINRILSEWKSTKTLIYGAKCVIVGKPNVGKSMLFNSIIGYSRAIVSPIPGTTRDFIDSDVDIGGAIVKIVDTAGVRKTYDPIEKEGIERTLKIADSADILICVFDSSEKELQEDDEEVLKIIKASQDKKVIIAINKIDIGYSDFWINLLRKKIEEISEKNIEGKQFAIIPVSAKERIGIDAIKEEILKFFSQSISSSESVSIITSRQKAVAEEILQSVFTARNFMVQSDYLGTAYSLRNAIKKIDEMLGKESSHEIIDKIFSTFCIGK
ncbi:tRNA modification GTPase MnmE [bacterium HR19]|nr:tRNA modification GTPase MnmE [bacterium HR19]